MTSIRDIFARRGKSIRTFLALASIALVTFGEPPPHAAAQEPTPLRFVVVGDTQTDGDENSVNWDVLTQLVQDMNAHDPELGLFVGDLVGGSNSLATKASPTLSTIRTCASSESPATKSPDPLTESARRVSLRWTKS